MAKEGFVYLIRKGDTSYYKIGKTTSSPEERRKQLQTGNEKQLKVFYSVKVNRYSDLERRLEDENRTLKTDSGGDEWYEFSNQSVKRVVWRMRDWCRREAFVAATRPLKNLEGSCITDAEKQLATILSSLANRYIGHSFDGGAEEILRRLNEANLLTELEQEVVEDYID